MEDTYKVVFDKSADESNNTENFSHLNLAGSGNSINDIIFLI